MRKGVQRSLPTANGDPSDRHPTQARGSPQPRAPRTSTMSSHRAPGCRHACQGAGFPGRSSARPPLLPLPPGPPRRPPRSRGRPRSVAGCPSHTRPNTEKQSAKRRRRVKEAAGARRRGRGGGGCAPSRGVRAGGEGTPRGAARGGDPVRAGPCREGLRPSPGSARQRPAHGPLARGGLGRLGERGPGAGPTLALQSLWNQAVVQGPMSQASLLGGRGGPVAHSRSLTSSPLLPTQRTCRLRWPRPHRTEHCGGEAGRAGPSWAELGPGLPSSRPAVALEPAGHPDPWPSGYTALRGEQGTLGPVLVGPPT